MKFLKMLRCIIFGHRLAVLRIYPELDSTRLYCEKCKGEWVRNKQLQLTVKWDKDLAAIHFDLDSAEAIIAQYNKEQHDKKK